MSARPSLGASNSTLEIARRADCRIYRGTRRDLLELGLATEAMLNAARPSASPQMTPDAAWSITRVTEQDRYELIVRDAVGAARRRRTPLRLASCTDVPRVAASPADEADTDDLLTLIREYTQLGTATLDLLAALLRRAALEGQEFEQISAAIARLKRVYVNLELRHQWTLSENRRPARN